MRLSVSLEFDFFCFCFHQQVLIRSMSQRYEVSSHPQPVVKAARRYSERLQTLREELDAKDVDLKARANHRCTFFTLFNYFLPPFCSPNQVENMILTCFDCQFADGWTVMAIMASQVFQAEALMLQLCTPNEWHFYRRDKTDTPVAMPETFLAIGWPLKLFL